LVLAKKRQGWIGEQIPLSTKNFLQFAMIFEKKSQKSSPKFFPYKNFENLNLKKFLATPLKRGHAAFT